MALTIGQITEEAMSVLEREMYDATPYCLVVITLKDGTSQEIIIKIRPRDLHEIGAELKNGIGLTLDNDESAILVMADQIKHITIMKVTKEQA